MHRRFVAVALAALSLGFAARAAASVVFAYDLPRLVSSSEHVVDARVVATSSRYEGSQIVTDVRVALTSVGKGAMQHGQMLDLVLLGGSVDGVTMRVEGAVQVAPGDEAVFFLGRHASGVLTPVGLSQGVMRIVDAGGTRMVQPGGAGLVLLRRDAAGRMVPSGSALDRPTPADTVIDRVRALAGGTR